MKIGGISTARVKIGDLPCEKGGHGSLSIPRTQIPALIKAFKPLQARLAESPGIGSKSTLPTPIPKPGIGGIGRSWDSWKKIGGLNIRNLQSVLTTLSQYIDMEFGPKERVFEAELKEKKEQAEQASIEAEISEIREAIDAVKEMVEKVQKINKSSFEVRVQNTRSISS